MAQSKLDRRLCRIRIFSSYARGDYNSSSDVDVMILVKMSDNEIKKIENQVYDLAFDIEMDTLDTAKICMDVMH